MAEFADITMREADERESFRRSGGFLEQAYNLSSVPTVEWEAIFRRCWDEVDFFPKRHARIENHRVVFVCLEHELHGFQMASLIDAVARANIEYRKWLDGRG
jgi:hypothetical protein